MVNTSDEKWERDEAADSYGVRVVILVGAIHQIKSLWWYNYITDCLSDILNGKQWVMKLPKQFVKNTNCILLCD